MQYYVIAHFLSTMGVGKPQQKFLLILFSDWLAVSGRYNYVNLSRFLPISERTIRRWFRKDFDWARFNSLIIERLLGSGDEVIAALDASFVAKSGKKTQGLGCFYSGCAGRAIKGLELSLMCVVNVTKTTAFPLHAQQTLDRTPNTKRNDQVGIEAANPELSDITLEETRADQYLDHVRHLRQYLPARVRYLAVDGFYAKIKFVSGVCATNLDVIGKLRKDANMKYLYSGAQKPRGRPRVHDGKVLWSALNWAYWKDEGCLNTETHIYSARLHHCGLQRVVKVVLLRCTKGDKISDALLFSTDLEIGATDLIRYYKARFQIEFLFRDAKQGTGLTHCQARDSKAIQFHWNAAFSALNLAKLMAHSQARERDPSSFSIASCRLKERNRLLIDLFSLRLGLDLNSIKSNPASWEVCNLGAIQS